MTIILVYYDDSSSVFQEILDIYEIIYIFTDKIGHWNYFAKYTVLIASVQSVFIKFSLLKMKCDAALLLFCYLTQLYVIFLNLKRVLPGIFGRDCR